jgi:hypothetical protein
VAESLTGRKLAEAAHLYARRRDPHRSGLAIDVMVGELETSNISIAGDDPWSTLRTSLNGAQDIWINANEAGWRWIEEIRPIGGELSGRALSDVVYDHVRGRYPNERTFHYEEAKEQLLRKGVRIKGPVTGRTMRSALVGSPDRFESVARGMWRWKDVP